MATEVHRSGDDFQIQVTRGVFPPVGADEAIELLQALAAALGYTVSKRRHLTASDGIGATETAARSASGSDS